MAFGGFDVDFSNNKIFTSLNHTGLGSGSGIFFAPLSEFDVPSPSLQLLITVDEILGFETGLLISWFQVDELSEKIFFTTSAPTDQALYSVDLDGMNGQLIGLVPNINEFQLSPNENLIYYLSSVNQISAITYGGNSSSFQLVTEQNIRAWAISEGAAVTPTAYQWANTVGGTWDGNNWDVAGFPDGNSISAVLGNALSTASTVVTDSDRTLKSLTFDSSQSYNVAGLGTVVMEADAGSASIDVLQGTHQFQAVVAISPTNPSGILDVDVSAGAVLSFNNELVLNGNSLNKTGLGTLEINNQLAAGSGMVIVAEGLLGGSGTVGGDLVVNGGGISPGVSPGTLSVLGDYLPDPNSSLLIELGGTQIGEWDLLDIAGMATLAGTLGVSLIPGFVPQSGDSFEFLTAAGGVTGIFSETLPSLSPGLVWDVDYNPNSVVLLVALQLPGDFDFNGEVNGFDFLLWQRDPSIGSLADWEANYGMVAPLSASSAATVPEPSALLLGVMASMGLMLRRRCLIR